MLISSPLLAQAQLQLGTTIRCLHPQLALMVLVVILTFLHESHLRTHLLDLANPTLASTLPEPQD
jgi:hypothetical protein